MLSLFLYIIDSHASFKVRLLNNSSKTDNLTKIILNVIKEKNPQSVKQLKEILNQTLNVTEKEILKAVMKMQAEELIILNQSFKSKSFVTHMKSGNAVWYWMTIGLCAVTATLVFAISENYYPWIYARNFLGTIFVLFLPGYALMKTLFPIDLQARTSKESLASIERFALSIGLSIALVAIVGLLLYYSPLGLDLITAFFSLLALSVIFATIGAFREFHVNKTDLDGSLAV